MAEAGARRARVWAMTIEDLFADLVDGEVASPVDGPLRMPPPQLFEALPLPAEFQQTFLVEVPFETLAGARFVEQVRVHPDPAVPAGADGLAAGRRGDLRAQRFDRGWVVLQCH